MVLLPACAQAAVTGTATAKITIPKTCTMSSSTSLLDFGTQTVTGTTVTQTDGSLTGINVFCSYNSAVSVYATSANASSSQFRLKNGSTYLNYNVYSDSSRSTAWPQSSGATGASATGNGTTALSYALYGRIPAQSITLPGTYTDTITVTVSY
jgi:spore coat protein U-like protein